MPLWVASAAAWLKLVKERVRSVVPSPLISLPRLKAVLSPRYEASTVAAASLSALPSAAYSGMDGEVMRGAQEVSTLVPALPSMSPLAIAVSGRQNCMS